MGTGASTSGGGGGDSRSSNTSSTTTTTTSSNNSSSSNSNSSNNNNSNNNNNNIYNGGAGGGGGRGRCWLMVGKSELLETDWAVILSRPTLVAVDGTRRGARGAYRTFCYPAHRGEVSE